jgi:hypothetical protein
MLLSVSPYLDRFSIRGSGNFWIGALHLNNDPSSPTTPKDGQIHLGGRTVELVEISRGYIYEFQTECSFDE